MFYLYFGWTPQELRGAGYLYQENWTHSEAPTFEMLPCKPLWCTEAPVQNVVWCHLMFLEAMEYIEELREAGTPHTCTRTIADFDILVFSKQVWSGLKAWHTG